jgi:Sec23-binding domain of Sec16
LLAGTNKNHGVFNFNTTAFRLAELFEAIHVLNGSGLSCLPYLQYHKIWYASCLADHGRIDLAAQYVRLIARNLKQNNQSPFFNRPFLAQLTELEDRLNVTFDLKQSTQQDTAGGWFGRFTGTALTDHIENLMNTAVGVEPPKVAIKKTPSPSSLYPVPKPDSMDSPGSASTMKNTSSGASAQTQPPPSFSSSNPSAAYSANSAPNFNVKSAQQIINHAYAYQQPMVQEQQSAGNGFPYKYPNSHAPSKKVHESAGGGASLVDAKGSHVKPITQFFEPPRNVKNYSSSVQKINFNVAAPATHQGALKQPTVKQQTQSEIDEDLGFGNSSLKKAAENIAEKKETKQEPDIGKTVEKKASFLSFLWGAKKSDPTAPQAHLPSGSNFVYDKESKRWINKAADSSVAPAPKLAPPPILPPSSGMPPMGNSVQPPHQDSSDLSQREVSKRGAKSRYVDILSSDVSQSANTAVPSFFPSYQQANVSTKIYVFVL